MHGDYRSGVYMEFANGYGVRDYRVMLGSSEANKTRLKTPSEFRSSALSGDGFPGSLLRQVLFAIYKTAESDHPSAGQNVAENRSKKLLGQEKHDRRASEISCDSANTEYDLMAQRPGSSWHTCRGHRGRRAVRAKKFRRLQEMRLPL